MTLADKQRHLIERYLSIHDTHERLAAMTSGVRKLPPLPGELRIDSNRVPGCVSRVWLVGEFHDGVCHFRIDAESPLVGGLVSLWREIYDGAAPREILEFTPELLETLGLERQLSPTRLHGLKSVQRAICQFAAGHVTE